MQDVVVKKSRSASHETAVHHAAHETKEPHHAAATHHVEDSLPKISREEKRKEAALERSPIFEKMRQRHEERGSFSDEYTTERKLGYRRYSKKAAAIAGVVAVIGIFAYGIISYAAFVKISLKHADVALNNREFQAAADVSDAIPFQIMTLTEEQYVGLIPTGEKNVSTKASGIITIYNEYSAQSQILIKNTRFQAPDGKIYRIDKQVIIPGETISGGKKVPGTIDATIYADGSGPAYNIASTDFTIPGFKGSPRYTKFYAKSKTAIAGGAQGVQKIVSEDDIKQTRMALTDSLKKKLLSKAQAEHPKGTILFQDAIFYTFTDSTDDSTVAGTGSVKFTLKGTLQSVLFDSAALGRKIVGTSSSISQADEIEVQNIKELTFTWKNPGSSVPKTTDKISFILAGSAHAVWVLDTEALKAKLLGVKKADYKLILAQFSGIEKATAKIRPFWKTVFPKNPDKIYVETTID